MPIPLIPLALGAAAGGLAGYLGGRGSASQPQGQASGSIPGVKSYGGAGNFLTGYDPKVQQFPRFNEQQQGVQNQALMQLMSLLQGGKAPGSFDFAPIAQQARTQFQTQTIPGLAERFTAMGGGQRSSAFQGALGRAGAGLEEGLAALQSKYGLAQQGQNNQLLQLLMSLGMQSPFETAYSQGQPGFAQSIAPAAGQLGGLAGLSYLGLL
jgi:hypothetical protein